MSELEKNIKFVGANNIIIKDFKNPWNDRELWYSFLDINIIKKYCGENPKNIIEFGSYDGGDGIRYKYYFPNTNVFSIEPSPKCYKNTKLLEKYGLKVFNYAISDENKLVDFYQTFDDVNNQYGPCSSIDKKYCHVKFQNRNDFILHHIKIQGITIEKFCIDNNIEELDVMHVDVEGHAREVLNGLGKMRPKIIFVEVKSTTHNHSKDINEILKKLNYKIIIKRGADETWVHIKNKTHN
jgi:FkbM family methyltransferase